jgi:dolichyl-phosphate beta-glucosyltransferase
MTPTVRLGVDAEVAVVANQFVQQRPVRTPVPDPNPAVPSSPAVTTALTVVLPCYNEAERLPGTLAAYLRQLSWAPGQVEVLVVDDGSTDATRAVAEAAAAADPRVRMLGHRPNRGKGFAVRAGMLAARGDLVVFADADGSYGPDDLRRVVEALAEAPVAIGARTESTTASLVRQAASRGFNLAIRSVLGLPFQDTQSGLKGFRRAAALAIFSRTRLDGFAFDVEVLFLADRLGLDVAQVGVQARECEGSKVRVAVDAQRMLRDVWAVRRLAASGAYGGLLAGLGQPEAVSN